MIWSYQRHLFHFTPMSQYICSDKRPPWPWLKFFSDAISFLLIQVTRQSRHCGVCSVHFLNETALTLHLALRKTIASIKISASLWLVSQSYSASSPSFSINIGLFLSTVNSPFTKIEVGCHDFFRNIPCLTYQLALWQKAMQPEYLYSIHEKSQRFYP